MDSYYYKKKDIFILAIIIYYFCALIPITMLDHIGFISIIANIGRYLSYLLFALVIVFPYLEYKKKIFNIIPLFTIKLKEFVIWISKQHIFIFMIFLTFIIFLNSHNTLPLLTVIIFFAASSFEFDFYLSRIFSLSVAFMFLTLLLEVINILPDVTIWREDGSLRYSMGYTYPLELMSHFLFIVFMYVYIYKEKFNLKYVVALLFYGILFYKITDARTSFIILLFFLFMIIVIQKFDIGKILFKIPKIVFIFLVVALFISPIMISLFYDSSISILDSLNKLLSNRLSLGHSAIQQYGFTLFGQPIEWIGFGGLLDPNLVQNTYNFVDCWYVQNLLDNGIIYEICILLGYIYIVLLLLKQKNLIGLLIIFSILIISWLEPRLMMLSLNPFSFLMCPLLLNDIEKVKK